VGVGDRHQPPHFQARHTGQKISRKRRGPYLEGKESISRFHHQKGKLSVKWGAEKKTDVGKKKPFLSQKKKESLFMEFLLGRGGENQIGYGTTK